MCTDRSARTATSLPTGRMTPSWPAGTGSRCTRFWYYIFEQMPEGEPPYTLSREQVTDVVTYILQLNALPEGTAELGAG